MEYEFEIRQLDVSFYKDYPRNIYPEIERKKFRGYNCLIVDTHLDYYICIPYRSHIRHSHAFKFQNTSRSKLDDSGLDYSKIIIVTLHHFKWWLLRSLSTYRMLFTQLLRIFPTSIRTA